jgi:hypothetical protein
MLAYSFLMLQSSSRVAEEAPSLEEGFSPSTVRHTTLAAIHRQVLMWLLEDVVVWLVETDRIKSFRPRRN